MNRIIYVSDLSHHNAPITEGNAVSKIWSRPPACAATADRSSAGRAQGATNAKRLIITVLACLVIAGGCATVPFEPVSLPPIGDVTAEALRRSVAATAPQRFALLQSAVFEYRGHAMAAICITEIDVPQRSYSVVAMTPMGVKLFEVRGRDGRLEQSFVAPGLDAWGDVAEAIAKDIQRVYLDSVPAADARTHVWRRQALFRDAVSEGRREYIVGGDPPVLIRKRLYDRQGAFWDVNYYEYTEYEGNQFAGGIVFANRRYGYRLVLRLKEILADPPDTRQ